MNIKTAKLATSVTISIERSHLSIFTPKQGNPPSIIIQSSSFHTTNQTKIQKNCKYGFEDIKNLDSALSVFHKMLQMKPTPHIRDYNKFLNIIVKKKHTLHAILMFKKLSLLGYPIDEYTRNIVINCCCNLKEVALGFAVLASFLKRGYVPDIVSVSCLIKGLFLKRNVDEAVELFKRLVRYKLCEVDEFTVSIVLDGLSKSGNIIKAVKLLEVLEKGNHKLDVVVYNTVIDGLCKSRMIDDAMDVLSKMSIRGIVPDVVTYNSLIHELCSLSRWDDTKELLKQMSESKVYPDMLTFTSLVDSYCKEGLTKDAEDVVKIMIERGIHPDVFTYNALMDGYCLHGQLDKAKKLLRLMEKKGLEPDLFSYGTIINGYCKNKKIDHAWELFKEMCCKGLNPDTPIYSTMMQGLFSVGRCSDALELFDEIKNSGLVADRYVYGIVLDGLLANGKIEDATFLYHEVESRGLACNVRSIIASFMVYAAMGKLISLAVYSINFLRKVYIQMFSHIM